MEIGLVLATLAVVAGAIARLRVRRKTRDPEVRVTEEVIRRIEREGRVETEETEPLDWDRIREEEERFWGETWDRPDSLWD